MMRGSRMRQRCQKKGKHTKQVTLGRRCTHQRLEEGIRDLGLLIRSWDTSSSLVDVNLSHAHFKTRA